MGPVCRARRTVGVGVELLYLQFEDEETCLAGLPEFLFGSGDSERIGRCYFNWRFGG